MVKNFVSYNPVSLHFGQNIILSLAKVLKLYGKRILMIYGQSSIKKYGYYDQIKSQLIDFEVFDYSGIKANPSIEDVYLAIKKGKKENIDMILAVGGGSVIDTAKVVSLGITNDIDAWDFVKGKVKSRDNIPLITILTLAATGTEMNGAAVIQNKQSGEKIGFFSPMMYPKHSFLDPSYTFSVSEEYTAYATADIIAHALEAYFGAGEPSVTDEIIFGIIRSAIKYGRLCIQEPQNYDYRANHMLAATLALNGITNYGKKGGDWGVHSIGHNFSLAFDTPHGASLSLCYPAWLRFHANKIPQRIAKLGKNLWNVNTVEETIIHLENFFSSISCPIRLNELSLNSEQISEVQNLIIKNKASGSNHYLNEEDLLQIINFMN